MVFVTISHDPTNLCNRPRLAFTSNLGSANCGSSPPHPRIYHRANEGGEAFPAAASLRHQKRASKWKKKMEYSTSKAER